MKDLWIPVSGAVAQQRNVDIIANNIANANTPGFKKDQASFKEYLTALDKGLVDIDIPNKEWSPDDFYRTYGMEASKVDLNATFTIHEQGQLSPTGNPLDLALKGKGFFSVLTPNGVRYTRKGNFSVNVDGLLTTADGFPVLSNMSPNEKDHSNRVIQLQSGKVSINLQGDVFSNGNKISTLSINEFNDPHALRKEGNSFFINSKEENIKKDDMKTVVYQGFIEGSNVNAVEEMSKLIKANRNFESIQRVIKTYDNMAGKSVNELTKF